MVTLIPDFWCVESGAFAVKDQRSRVSTPLFQNDAQPACYLLSPSRNPLFALFDFPIAVHFDKLTMLKLSCLPQIEPVGKSPFE